MKLFLGCACEKKSGPFGGECVGGWLCCSERSPMDTTWSAISSVSSEPSSTVKLLGYCWARVMGGSTSYEGSYSN